jgi:hypothetical protein
LYELAARGEVDERAEGRCGVGRDGLFVSGGGSCFFWSGSVPLDDNPGTTHLSYRLGISKHWNWIPTVLKKIIQSTIKPYCKKVQVISCQGRQVQNIHSIARPKIEPSFV